MTSATTDSKQGGHAVCLFLCGDVMTGRGIDQILPHPSRPRIYEPSVHSALDYVSLAEEVNGRILRPAPAAYIWGDALDELEQSAPDARIINLETAVTTHSQYEPKGINYRMHPRNIDCLTAAKIDCCVLANNHVLDWGCAGLVETLSTLRVAQIKYAGAGRNRREAESPAVIEMANGGRVVAFAFGDGDCGIPQEWAATEDKPGVAYLQALSDVAVERLSEIVADVKRAGDIVVMSLHWGGNWGYAIAPAQRRFARALIDKAAVDIVHGHSSHHPKAIEVHNGKVILYGCGDLLNDYEGIAGYEAYRGELGLMYFLTVDIHTGKLLHLRMTPTRIQRFRLCKCETRDAQWLADMLNREGAEFGTGVTRDDGNHLVLHWRS